MIGCYSETPGIKRRRVFKVRYRKWLDFKVFAQMYAQKEATTFEKWKSRSIGTDSIGG